MVVRIKRVDTHQVLTTGLAHGKCSVNISYYCNFPGQFLCLRMKTQKVGVACSRSVPEPEPEPRAMGLQSNAHPLTRRSVKKDMKKEQIFFMCFQVLLLPQHPNRYEKRKEKKKQQMTSK